jgi:uncharacterized membrane protein
MRHAGAIAAAAAILLAGGCENREDAPAPDNAAAAEGPSPGGAIPAAFHGTYAASAEGCARGDETRMTVAAGELRFHESAGSVRSVAMEAPGRIRVAADFQGEGERWSADHRLILSADGSRLTVSGRGVELARVRCPAAAGATPPAPPALPGAPDGWDLQSSGEGAALVLSASSGAAAIRLFCPARSGRLLVNVPGFRPVGSEERLSFGSGGNAHALVADSRGDRQRGGVTGAGAVPSDLAALLGGPISASYGAQTSGPHPAPPRELARGFVAACTERAAPSTTPAATPAAGTAGGACHVQGSERVQVRPMRALGTEPFWNARIYGRCVTYSHPDDQSGTRIWTRYTAGAGGAGTWSGALGGRRFELRIRPQPGCSDGMSDRRYPFAAELAVAGEQRRGCAERL